jgi:type I restriction enzyme R subunit
VDELAEDEEESAQAQLKSRWAALEKVVGAEPRVASVAADLVAHFEERNKAQDGKAMVVAMSRDICVHLYDEIIKLRPDWHDTDPEKGAIKIIMTGSPATRPCCAPTSTAPRSRSGWKSASKTRPTRCVWSSCATCG